MDNDTKLQLLSLTREGLVKLNKKKLVELYKTFYSEGAFRSSMTKTKLIEDIIEAKKYTIRNDSIKNIVV